MGIFGSPSLKALSAFFRAASNLLNATFRPAVLRSAGHRRVRRSQSAATAPVGGTGSSVFSWRDHFSPVRFCANRSACRFPASRTHWLSCAQRSAELCSLLRTSAARPGASFIFHDSSPDQQAAVPLSPMTSRSPDDNCNVGDEEDCASRRRRSRYGAVCLATTRRTGRFWRCADDLFDDVGEGTRLRRTACVGATAAG